MDNSKKTKVISQLAIIISILVCVIIVKFIGLIPDKLNVEYIEENYIASIEFNIQIFAFTYFKENKK